MPPFKPSPSTKRRPVLNEVVKNWSGAYMSYADALRGRKNVFSDMYNIDLVQDGIPTPRKGLVQYGVQPLGTVIGVGCFTKAIAGVVKPEQWEIQMQVISGVGKIVIRKDGGSWTTIGGSYNTSAWTTFTQSNNRVYISNKVDTMSYYDIATGTIITYTAISTPTGVSATPTGLSGSVVTYRYRVSANNNVGETIASVAVTATVGEYRSAWNPASQYVTVSWSAVAGATSYNVYIGTSAGNDQYLTNVAAGTLSFKDNNKAQSNPFKIAPEGNSTSGPVLGVMIASAGQLFGLQDKDNVYRLWYSGTGDKSGDFSPFNGGGWVDVNLGGDSIPTALKQFRDGRGNSAVTILTKGGASKGEVFHLSFQQQTLADFTITYPVIQAANGQSGAYSAMGVVEANNSLHYISGKAFKTTGTRPQMVNILVTGNTSDTIQPDVDRLNLAALDKAVGLEYDNRIYWCLPVGSTENSEMWVQDLSRGGGWILRWSIPAKYTWLYEDSTGTTHHCVLVNNKILEFSKSALTTDDGVAFKTRLASNIFTFDESGLQMAAVEMARFLLLRPRGEITVNIYGLGEDSEAITGVSSETVNPQVTPTGWDDFEFDTQEFDYDIGAVQTVSKGLLPIPIEVDEVVCQLSFDITTANGDVSYILNSALLTGKVIPKLYYGDD